MHSFAGQVLSYDNISEVIKFCAREKLVLFADEVYQETVFTNEVQFHSCKKVLRDLGPEYNKFQLMSIHSASKGFYGEYVQVDFVISKTQQRSMRRALKQPKIKNILKQSNIPNYSNHMGLMQRFFFLSDNILIGFVFIF